MEQTEKHKMSQKEFDERFEITGGITGENSKETANPTQEDTTPITEPEFLTEEEQEYDDKMHEDHIMEDIQE